MNDETPDTLHLPSFEEQVLAQLESIDSRIVALEKRQEERDYDTTTIWNRVLNGISELKTEVSELHKHMDNFDRKLEVVNKELLQVKSDVRALEMG